MVERTVVQAAYQLIVESHSKFDEAAVVGVVVILFTPLMVVVVVVI